MKKPDIAVDLATGASGQPEVTQWTITRVLIVGFSAVIVLLAAGAVLAVRNIGSIQKSAASLLHQQRLNRHLIEDLQEEQTTLSKIFYTVTGDPDTANEQTIARSLSQVDKDLQNLEKEAQPGPRQRPVWDKLLLASHSFGIEARRLLTTPEDSPGQGSRDLFRAHEQVISLISKLVGEGFQSVQQAEASIESGSKRFVHDSLILVLASFVLALLSSWFTVRWTRQLIRSMAWQDSELTRVSWQMLASHESIARRFSHELHDELGQTLAALRSNLGAMRVLPEQQRRLIDSLKLVDDSISNVRELSQLLRPMILDDFGLDAGLAWLCEGFMQRTRIEVDYASDYHGRLPDETETHLFRIGQEALTNVARHSGATRVRVKLHADDKLIQLSIVDNGRGIQLNPDAGPSLGMTGMRARARALGGLFRASEAEGGGLKVEAQAPLPLDKRKLKENHESHSNLVS